MFYQFYEWNHAFLSPARAVNDAVRLYYKNPLNPFAHTEIGRQIVAAGDLFERMTRRYGKPEFGLDTVEIDGEDVAVEERVVWERSFCRLIHFRRARPANAPKQPKLVIVAPMSGHHSTLLRGTVAALLPHHEVYITDWVDARLVPLAMGRFDLDDYIDYVTDIISFLNGEAHLVAVCQPAVPVFAATALLEASDARFLPRSITLMGGPIDTRESPTEVNLYAAKHDLDWFRRNVILTVPYPYPGVMRRVYPGFLQLSGFMTMNLDRHLSAHYDYFDHLVNGDGDSADKHREFYDEYLSVMDLTAEFYLQTVDTVFLRQALPKGEMLHRGRTVDPSAITRTPILTIEGEKDDISGIGQTRAAHKLTPHLPAERHQHYEQKGVGHYGVFNGSRFRREIAPRITAWVAAWDDAEGAVANPAPTQPMKGALPEEAADLAAGIASIAPTVAAAGAAPFAAADPENVLRDAFGHAPTGGDSEATGTEPAASAAAPAPWSEDTAAEGDETPPDAASTIEGDEFDEEPSETAVSQSEDAAAADEHPAAATAEGHTAAHGEDESSADDDAPAEIIHRAQEALAQVEEDADGDGDGDELSAEGFDRNDELFTAARRA